MEKTIIQNDWLLKTGKVVSTIFRYICLTFAIVAGAIGVLALIAGTVAVFAPEAFANANVDDLGIAESFGLGLLLGLAAWALWLSARFLKHLVDIIITVGEGDPFVGANAERLQSMAKICLVIFALSVIATLGAVAYIALDLPMEGTFEFDVSLESLLLALVLFILARVFRHGAAMREDLEGTV